MEPELQGVHPKHTEQNQEMQKTESAENFQKFIYDLFDKNGILNDLRAYLRGHIIDVLKGAQTGDPPSCQKNFTQRLDSTLQALNILVAECLLCLEFNYSLSVFVSEIPLANMVFAFAKSLMDLGADGEATGLRFSEKDVWAILNCLGMKCESEHVNKVYELYKKQHKSPLLLCILKCSQLCKMEETDAGRISDSSISDSSKSFLKRSASRCRHRAFCKACRRRYRHLQDKYRTKKAHIIQKAQANTNLWNVETIVKNIGELERTLVDEMFEQLKSVYETEMEMFKAEHEGKIKNSLDSHMQHFQQMKNELEESYKAREAALKANVMQKKRFLWELAQALRAQHTQMAKAMQAVRRQTAELAVQEQHLKLQRTQAEESLKQRAEEMRQQMADELVLLEERLESMKTEREGIIRERATNSETKVNMEIKNYLQNHYHLWKEELNELKMYIENTSFQPKSVIERSTVTDDGFKGMNNEREGLAREGRPNQVVNNLKKQKNVNFNQGKSEGPSRSDSSTSSDADVRRRTQPVQVSLATPLQQAPAVPAPRMEHSRVETESGWRKGAGEERSLLGSARVLVPGDTLPFVGVVGRRSEPRRHLLSRWRVLRRRASPPAPAAPPAPPAPRPRADPPAESMEIRTHSSSSIPAPENEEKEEAVNDSDNLRVEPDAATESPKTKSPRSVLKEAKEKLKTVTRASTLRESSPSALLREAKLRLRKLEIEAEAVERSYQDYRKRRERKDDQEPTCVIPTTASKLSMHHTEAPEHSKSEVRATDSMHLNLEKYLNKYQINLDVGDHFKSKNATATQQKPVPATYSEININETYSEINRNFAPIPKQDFLEKPITEFRKLYYTNQERSHPSNQMSPNVQESLSLGKSTENILKEKCSELRKEKDTKRKEIEILKENITKIYNLQDDIKETNEVHSEDNIDDNLLIVEVENITERRDLNMQSESDMVLIVESSVDSKDIVVSEYGDSIEDMLTKMTIVISPKQNDPSDIVIERKETIIPRSRTPSPQIGQLSPPVKQLSPPVRQLSPRVRPKSPLVRTPSPTVRQPSPQVGQLSPQARQLSPRVRPQSPRVRTLSPTIRQPSQPSPQAGQLSPRVRPQPLVRTQSDATNIINKITEFLEASGDKDSEEDLHLELRDEPDSEIQIRHNAPSGTGEAADDYPDDFSYDVDNYKSGEHSPISLAKTSEDENFWD